MSFLKRLKTFMGKKSKQTVKVSWIGLDYAGKSTIIKRVTQGLFSDDTKRTLGLNVDEFESEGIKFVCWDIGGQTVFRDSLWESYISGSSGIIFVVDSATLIGSQKPKKNFGNMSLIIIVLVIFLFLF